MKYFSYALILFAVVFGFAGCTKSMTLPDGTIVRQVDVEALQAGVVIAMQVSDQIADIVERLEQAKTESERIELQANLEKQRNRLELIQNYLKPEDVERLRALLEARAEKASDAVARGKSVEKNSEVVEQSEALLENIE